MTADQLQAVKEMVAGGAHLLVQTIELMETADGEDDEECEHPEEMQRDISRMGVDKDHRRYECRKCLGQYTAPLNGDKADG